MRRALSGMRRFAWAGVALWLIVAIGAIVGYARTPLTYVASQSLVVTLAPIGSQTTATQQQLETQADELARTIASPAFLTSTRFTAAVSQQIHDGNLTHDLSPEAIGSALSGTNTGARVTFTAHASVEAQAVALAQAATQTLAQHSTELLSTPDASTFRLVPNLNAPTAMRDAVADDAARSLLLARLGLATGTALLLTFALGWLTGRSTDAPTSERATSGLAEPTGA